MGCFCFPLICGDRADRQKRDCRFKGHLLECVPDADSYI